MPAPDVASGPATVKPGSRAPLPHAETLLDTEGVRAVVRVIDRASFSRAADSLATSQAAISLRVKRLEDRLGLRLVDWTPRHAAPTPRGARFLPSARLFLEAHARAVADLSDAPPPRLGLISDHVAGPDRPGRPARLGLEGPACPGGRCSSAAGSRRSAPPWRRDSEWQCSRRARHRPA